MRLFCPSSLYGDERIDKYGSEHLLSSALVNQSTPWQAELVKREDKYLLPEDIRSREEYLIKAFKKGKNLTDGGCIRLVSDIERGQRRIEYQVTGYFNSLLSNYLTREFAIDELKSMGIDIEKYVLDKGELIKMSLSQLANTIGISSLLITKDEYLVLSVQGDKSTSSAGLFVPSGSGSLEPVDLFNALTLEDGLIRGVERELIEETSIDIETPLTTQIITYGRWLEKAAKPEFFAISKTPLLADQLRLSIGAHEEEYISEHLLIHSEQIDTLDPSRISLPLGVCLSLL